MARAKQITADKLERLGVRRLAEIIDEHAGADAILRRKLTIALAALDGGDKFAVTLGKRIHTIGRSRSFLDWEKGRELAKEIDHLRTTVAGPLAARLHLDAGIDSHEAFLQRLRREHGRKYKLWHLLGELPSGEGDRMAEA